LSGPNERSTIKEHEKDSTCTTSIQAESLSACPILSTGNSSMVIPKKPKKNE
jgi:hypothetical protein